MASEIITPQLEDAADVIPASLLIVCDNFWTGGRESFIEQHLSLLREHGLKKVSLLANSIKNPRVNLIFDNSFELTYARETELEAKLAAIDDFMANAAPCLVWAHHFGLGTALLISLRYSKPLHITLHGAPFAHGRYAMNEALAFSLAVQASATFSCVSEEIVDQLARISNKIDLRGIIANKINLPKFSHVSYGVIRRLTLVMLSRQGKLDHLRQGLTLLSAFRQAGFDVTLNVFTGINQESSVAMESTSQWKRRARLYGRKWLLKNPRVWGVLPNVQIHAMTADIESAIEEADIVLGMGRVVLEALAHLRPAVLIGYEAVIGLVTPDRFSDYQKTNFSGREQTSDSLKGIVTNTIELLNAPQKLQQLQRLVDIELSLHVLKTILQSTVSGYAPVAHSVAVEEYMGQQLGGHESAQGEAALSVLVPPEMRALFDQLTDKSIGTAVVK